MTACPDTDPPAAERRQALNVVVAGDEVVILIAEGQSLRMDASAAEVSGMRLLDAATVARGRLPGARR